MEQDRKSRLIGYAALAISIVIWSAWIVYTRLGMRQAMPISVLILVQVAIETIKQVDSQLMLRNYEGFLK